MAEHTAQNPSHDIDEVDEIVEAWHRERPDLDLTPMHILSRVWRLAKKLDAARRNAFTSASLEVWEFDVLSALRRSGEPYQLSPGQLITETMVTSGTMTNRVDRLSERGHVTRAQSPTDRRSVIVQLTPKGLAAVDAALEDLLVAESELLATLSADEKDALAALLRRLGTTFDAPAEQA